MWRVTDDKPGHESQSLGLVEALSRKRKVFLVDIPALNPFIALKRLMFRSFRADRDWADPDLIIGAGHKTHFTVLAAQQKFGGKSVILMKPTLPLFLFDSVVIPQHDQPPARDNVLKTVGVLNTIQPSENSSAHKGLILIGGPSKHHGWDEADLIDQIAQLVQNYGDVDWELTTSRRTPVSTVNELLKMNLTACRVTRFEDTKKGWVRERLQECATVWVTEDSVSMLFEALTSGAKVGRLDVPRLRKRSRVYDATDGVSERLLALGTDGSTSVSMNGAILNEANRVARMILDKFHSE